MEKVKIELKNKVELLQRRDKVELALMLLNNELDFILQHQTCSVYPVNYEIHPDMQFNGLIAG